MKQWRETADVLAAASALVAARRRGALATVVRVQGSAYRHEGAKLLLAEDGTVVGNVSGGCLEQDVIEVASQVMSTGLPARRAWCGGSDEIAAWDLGVGCEGEVELLIEPLPELAAVQAWRAALAREQPCVVLSRLDDLAVSRCVVTAEAVVGSLGDAGLETALLPQARAWLGREGGTLCVVGEVQVALEALRPPPRVLVVSGADDARELAQVAHRVGFRVVVADKRPGWLTPTRFAPGIRVVECQPEAVTEAVPLHAEDFAVVMTHQFADDAAALRALLGSAVGYIGLLGPRSRSVRLHTAIGWDRADFDPRVHAPVGLDIGTDGAEQVALSVVAELLAARAGRAPRSLREGVDRIHPTPRPVGA
jgi:xanthine dehydrogenase accessory factor